MLTKIRELVNPEFFSKHAEVKPGAIIAKLLGQIVSGLTAFYALQSFLGIENLFINTSVAVGLAFLPELIIHYFGHGAMLPAVEALGKTKAYEIESSVQKLSEVTNIVKIIVVLFAFGSTTYFTVRGSFQYGYDKKHPGQAPDKTAIIKSQKAEGLTEYNRLNKPNEAKQKLIQSKIEAARQKLKQDQDFATTEWKRYNQNKNWTRATTKANRLLNRGGIEQQRQNIADLENQLALSFDVTAALAAKRDSMARADGLTTFAAANGVYSENVATANKSGNQILFVGIFAQFLVAASLFIIVMVDVGSGTVKDRRRHVVDGQSVPLEWLKVRYYRWKQKQLYKIAELSKQDLSIKDRPVKQRHGHKLIALTDSEQFNVFYLEEAKPRPKIAAEIAVKKPLLQQLREREKTVDNTTTETAVKNSNNGSRYNGKELGSVHPCKNCGGDYIKTVWNKRFCSDDCKLQFNAQKHDGQVYDPAKAAKRRGRKK